MAAFNKSYCSRSECFQLTPCFRPYSSQSYDSSCLHAWLRTNYHTVQYKMTDSTPAEIWSKVIPGVAITLQVLTENAINSVFSPSFNSTTGITDLQGMIDAILQNGLNETEFNAASLPAIDAKFRQCSGRPEVFWQSLSFTFTWLIGMLMMKWNFTTSVNFVLLQNVTVHGGVVSVVFLVSTIGKGEGISTGSTTLYL